MAKHIEPETNYNRVTKEELQHIASCPYCLEELADFIEKEALISAPKPLKATIMAQSKRLDVQIIAGSNHISKQLQLFYYSLKVGAAVICALFLLSIVPEFSRQMTETAIKSTYTAEQSAEPRMAYYETVDYLTKQLNKLSSKNLEVIKP